MNETSRTTARRSLERRVPARLAFLLIVLLAPALFAASPPSDGRALAQKYCATCHFFPEPDTLTKAAWMDHIRPGMAKWLGMEKPDDATMPDAERARQAALFPASPLLSTNDWSAIWDYYRAAAPKELRPHPKLPAPAAGQKQFRARKINPAAGAPMISLVKLDSARRQLFAGDAFAGMFYTMNATGDVLSRSRLGSPPVALAGGAGRQYLTLMGHLFPTEISDGSVTALSWRDGVPQPRLVLTNLHRPVQTIPADLNQDGREDLLVCTFGNRLGRFCWFENQGDGKFAERVLIDRPGAVHAEVLDANADGLPDIFVMMAQAREGIYLLLNEGRGRFSSTPIMEQPPTWGYAGFELTDFNRDGKIDFLAVNGDNGDWALPPKPYHGVRLYLNDGTNRFTEKFFHPLHGAYKALARDFDADGDLDIVAIAYYPNYTAATPQSFVYLENNGGLDFTPRTLPEAAGGRWLVMDAGDLDGDGDIDLALGSFVKGPTTQPIPDAVQARWRTNGAAVLLLENTRR